MLTLHSVWRSLRPKQWTKNAIVLAALLFGLGDPAQSHLNTHSAAIALAAMIIFCMVSSAIYLLNDIQDLELDRAHPTKKLRPLAAGDMSVTFARVLSAVLMCGGLASAWLINRPFFSVIAAYVLIQFCYTYGLKRVALVDLFIIATGFVLRALAGAVVIHVAISPWLLLCTLLLALFLALCKRRHEKVVIEDATGLTRPSLMNYDEKLLDQLISMIGASTMVTYALYTLSPETVHKFGTNMMGLTVPFVIFGLFRYLDLVYRHEKGGRPEQILLTDVPLLVDLALYVATAAAILYFT